MAINLYAHSSHPDVIKRLKRANGHLNKIIAMIEEERSCVEVAQQLQAVYSAIGNAKRVFIEDHIEGCLDAEAIANAKDARENIKSFKEITKYL